jgi:RNA polymerase sigma-70 factor (ECF subfamily)
MSEHEHVESLADEELLRNIGQDCSQCFELLFHRYYRQVHSISVRILRDRAEAEDILQEVFLSIYLQQERFDPNRGSVRTWILQFAYFKALLRRRYLSIRHFYKQEEISDAREIQSTQPSVSFGMNPTEWARYVETGIVTLSAKHRRIIELVHSEGYTLQEASEILRETLASTRNSYYRGLKALRDFLGTRTTLKKAEKNVALERNDIAL